MRAKLANWTDISDVALLKRLRNSEEWLRLLGETSAVRGVCDEALRVDADQHIGAPLVDILDPRD